MDFRVKTSASLLIVHFTSPEKHFEDKIEDFFGFFPGFELKIFQLLAETFGQVIRNCIERAQRNHLKETFLSEENFFLFWDFERKAFGLSAEKYWHGFWNWLLTFHRTFIWTITKRIFRFFSDFGLKLFGHLA